MTKTNPSSESAGRSSTPSTSWDSTRERLRQALSNWDAPSADVVEPTNIAAKPENSVDNSIRSEFEKIFLHLQDQIDELSKP